jgi:hypothetical protein
MDREQAYRALGGECGNTIAQTPMDPDQQYRNLVPQTTKETEMTTKEQIVVMQAYEDGKTITNECGGRVWIKHSATGAPQWDWVTVTYKIQPWTSLTLSGAKSLLDDDEIIEFYNDIEKRWYKITKDTFPDIYLCDENTQFRTVPEPTKVPLTAADITPTTWIKSRNGSSYRVMQYDSTGISFIIVDVSEDNGIYKSYKYYQDLLEFDWEISTTPDSFQWRSAYNLSDPHGYTGVLDPNFKLQ